MTAAGGDCVRIGLREARGLRASSGRSRVEDFTVRRTLIGCLVAATFLAMVPAATPPARADLPGFSISVWDIHTNGIWRKEVRRREIARWYRHYSWVSDVRLWLNRRAEGVWLTGQALTQFHCVGHCVLQNPNGPGVWRIWRSFTRTDVRRFRAHWRVFWAGHVNPVVANAAGPPTSPNPLNSRFMLTLDHYEVVTPMEPQDPNPNTPLINEAVMIMTDDGAMHFLGEPGFEQMPDTAANPNGFQLITTANTEQQLPPAPERLIDPPIPPKGMVEVSPGAYVEWLMDDFGNVLVDRDGDGAPDDPLSPGVLGEQKHQALLGMPTGQDGNELPIQRPNQEPQAYCWVLDPAGNVLGSTPGKVVMGPPVDLNGDGAADNAEGAPIPMEPTIRDENDVPMPTGGPVDFAVVEEDAPTAAELAEFNQRLIAAGFLPIQPPFRLCIRQLRARFWWGIDRRFVMDCWRHHWVWRVAHHINLTVGTHRVWLTRLALSQFLSSHHHFVVGQPPTWTMLNLTHVRFFRICYRVYCPRPNIARIRVDQIWLVVPVHPEDPNSDLMLLTNVQDENLLLPPAVLAGLVPDPLPVGPDGVLVEELDPVLDTLDIGGGGTGNFDGDLNALAMQPGVMMDVPFLGNEDSPERMDNNQLQLYCWALDRNGNLARETFSVGVPCPADLNGDGVVGAADLALMLGSWGFAPGSPADLSGDGFVNAFDLALMLGSWGPCAGPRGDVSFTVGPQPAMPEFTDDMGNPMGNPTDMGLMMQADPL